MFTGLIEEIGTVRSVQTMSDGRRLRIEAQTVLSDCKIDDSIAVNGICLTVVKLESNGFWVEAVGETLHKTTLGRWQTGERVNLERALRLSDRLGGHLVQGHVNGQGYVRQLKPLGENYFLEVEVPPSLLRYLIAEGSIAIDGISLTIARLNGNRVGISVIPHTIKQTNLQYRRVGDTENIEVDLIAKYVERLLRFGKTEEKNAPFSQDWFNKLGF